MENFEKELNELLKKHKVRRLHERRPTDCPEGKEPVQIIVNGKKMWVCR